MADCQGRGTAATGTLVLLMVVLCAGKAVMAANHVVGDSDQWTLGVDYTAWVTGKTFTVGDTLEFIYTSAHDVVEVSQADYTGCSKGTNTVFTTGDTTYNLTEVGSKYYICSVGNHCDSGMKVAINVVAASATPPTSSPTPTTPTTPTAPTSPTTPSTPGTTPTTPSTSNTPTPPSSPNSSTLSFSPTFFTLFLVVGLSILFFES